MDSGNHAFDNGDYKTAFEEFMQAYDENENNYMASLNLAILFENGWGIPKSYKMALTFYDLILDLDYGSEDLSISGQALINSINLIFKMLDEGVLTEDEAANIIKEAEYIERAMAYSIFSKETPDFIKTEIDQIWEEYELWRWEYKI